MAMVTIAIPVVPTFTVAKETSTVSKILSLYSMHVMYTVMTEISSG